MEPCLGMMSMIQNHWLDSEVYRGDHIPDLSIYESWCMSMNWSKTSKRTSWIRKCTAKIVFLWIIGYTEFDAYRLWSLGRVWWLLPKNTWWGTSSWTRKSTAVIISWTRLPYYYTICEQIWSKTTKRNYSSWPRKCTAHKEFIFAHRVTCIPRISKLPSTSSTSLDDYRNISSPLIMSNPTSKSQRDK